METLGPRVAVPPPVDGVIEPSVLAPEADDFWLEVGFGGGEHLAATARSNPGVCVIGCEHYLDGVGKMLSAIERDGLENVRVHPHDARDVMDALPDGCLGRAFVLYPDPWPKSRHHKRRFINDETLDSFARLLRPGAELRIASDIPDYIRHCLEALARRRREGRLELFWTAQCSADWRTPWDDWPGTRYEAKALREGRTPGYLTIRREAGS